MPKQEEATIAFKHLYAWLFGESYIKHPAIQWPAPPIRRFNLGTWFWVVPCWFLQISFLWWLPKTDLQDMPLMSSQRGQIIRWHSARSQQWWARCGNFPPCLGSIFLGDLAEAPWNGSAATFILRKCSKNSGRPWYQYSRTRRWRKFQKGKIYNAEEHVAIESFVTTLIHWTFFSDDANKVGICWLYRSGQLHVTPSSRWSLPRCHRSVRNDMRLFLRTKQYPVQLRTTKYYSRRYYSSTTKY